MPTTRLTFFEDDVYGVVLRSIENLKDGVTVTLANGPLFRVLVRNTVTGEEKTCEPGPATQVPVASVSPPFFVNNGPDPGYGAPDGLGTRSLVGGAFTFGPFSDGSHLIVFWAVTLLDSQPDRPRFSTWCFWSNLVTPWAVVWSAPVVMQMNPLPKDRYFIGCNGGLVTEAPQTDLRGNNDDYRFASAMRCEPEDAIHDTDRLEAFYPGPLGTDASGYGSRATNLSLLLHGDVSGKGSRVRDYFDGTSIIMEHQLQMQEATRGANNGQVFGFASQTTVEAHRYVAVFEGVGEVFGEELAFNWRRWLLSSVEGKAILPSRTRDRADMARYSDFPLWLMFDDVDAKGETGVTAQIADEYRLLFTQLVGVDLPRYVRSLLDFDKQEASGSHPALVGDAVQDLFDLASDAARRDFTKVMRSTRDLFTVARTKPRRPTPYDGNNYWDSYDGASKAMDAARVKNTAESALAVYKTTNERMSVGSVIVEMAVEGGFTYLRPMAALDKTRRDRFVTYPLGAHASHPQHMGLAIITHLGVPTVYVMERADETRWNNNFIAIAGDISASVSLPDVIVLLFMGDHFEPGRDRSGANLDSGIAPTSLCSYADDYGAEVNPALIGPLVRFGQQVEALFSEDGANDAGAGLLLEDALKNPVCWRDDHLYGYLHARGAAHQIQGWRRVLAALRTKLNASNGGQWMQFQDSQPLDFLLGHLDGTSQTFRKMALTTSKGSWGVSPFLTTALGDFLRTGFYDNAGLGHVTGAFGKSVYAAYEAAGVSGFVREAILADWLYGRKLISIGHEAGPIGLMGPRSDGQAGYSPLNHEDFGRGALTSIAAMISRMAQAQFAFGGANFHGQGMRSLERLGNSTEGSARGLLGFDGHDIGSQESGAARSHLMHAVVADATNRRKLIAFLGNPSLAVRGDSYRFRPNWFRQLIPGRVGSYRLTKYTFNVDGFTVTDLGVRHGAFEIVEQLGPGEFVAYTFEFVSGLRFKYRYDDEDFTEIDMAPEQTHMRVEPIQGQGARFQFGFVNDHPDEVFDLASIDLRTFLMGRSKNR